MHNIYRVRRVMPKDMETVENCYKYYDFLHINPYNREFLENIILYGQIWAVYDKNIIVACSCIFPGDIAGFAQQDAPWHFRDLLGTDLKDTLIRGYIYTDSGYGCAGITGMFCRLWQMQAQKRGKKQVLHYSPAHINNDMGRLTKAGYRLAGLRGLDRLVPHYIFIKDTGRKKQPSVKTEEIKKYPLSDTKEISRLCEQGYCGIAVDGEGNILFTNRR